MLKNVVATALVGLAAGEKCDGSPCQLLSVSTPSRLDVEENHNLDDPKLGVNTFTAVDKCAVEEVRDLTGWVLSYYEDVSNQLDDSFSNILITARMANSALTHLGHLSTELQALQRIQTIATQMNAMLRTCVADAMHLSASIQRCDIAFAHDNYGVDTVTTEGATGIDSVFIKPLSTSANGTCLAAICEHIVAYNQTCGRAGFMGDLERIASSHDLEGATYSFSSTRESSYHRPVTNLYADTDDAGTFAILNEDLFTQEYALLQRLSGWMELQFHAMMVMVRRNLNGGAFAQSTDIDLCSALGFPLDHVSWLSLAFEKCEGSMVRTWLKITPMNRAFMQKLVYALAKKIPNVYKEGRPGVLYGGPLSNLCTKFQDLEPEINAEMQKLQMEHAAMTDGSGDPKKINTFYLNGVAPVPEDGENYQKGDLEPFNDKTKTVQQWFMADSFMQPPSAFGDNR